MIEVVAIDPGDGHNGVVTANVGPGGVSVTRAKEINDRYDLFTYIRYYDPEVLIIEEYRLYPWQARNQGFSEFPTAQIIGVLDYLAHENGLTLHKQKAAVKKEARTMARARGIPMADRALGSGKGAYRGPDFDAAWIKREWGCKSSQHVRDAMAHLYWWAWCHPDSPAKVSRVATEPFPRPIGYADGGAASEGYGEAPGRHDRIV